MSIRHVVLGLALVATLSLGAVALAHVSPPVVLLSERDALAAMCPGAKSFQVREVHLTPAQRDAILQQWHWRADEPVYRFHVGLDDAGRTVAFVTFLAESTAHGRVRVAVAVGPDGRIHDARVSEATEESITWLKPLIDQGLTRDYVGRSCRDAFGVDRFEKDANSMRRFYAKVVASLVQRGAILFEVADLKAGGQAG